MNWLKLSIILLTSYSIIFSSILRQPVSEDLQSGSLTQVSPASCPSSGCSAGQRLNLKVDYDLSAYQPGTPNVQVCVYTPINWSSYLATENNTGLVSGGNYTFSTTNCETPPSADYNLAGGWSASLGNGLFGDSLIFPLRIGKTATTTGTVLVRVLEYDGAGWTRTLQTFLSIPVTRALAQSYVGNDAAACSVYYPCYINSADDLSSGYGTGLKDAIDAALTDQVITVLGSYLVKTNTVIVDQAVTIQGQNGSSLSGSGSICAQPVLKLKAAAVLSNLTISDGSCTSPSRDLVTVETPANVILESLTLTGGKNAVHATLTQTGNLLMQFNQVTGNSAYAVFWENPASTGTLTAVGNNFYNNNSTDIQVECSLKGKVDHNYWGAGIDVATAAPNCTASQNLALGAAGLVTSGQPGVAGELVTVSDAVDYAQNNKIGYQWSAAVPDAITDFEMYIVNHGSTIPESIPYSNGLPGSMTPCSSFFDVFLPDTLTLPDGINISLFVKYNLTSSCITTIESTRYCGQTEIPPDPSEYPLVWYNQASSTWITTGAVTTGQPTVCLMDSNEIKVTLDGVDGKPDLANLRNLAIGVGLPGQPSAVVIRNARVSNASDSILIFALGGLLITLSLLAWIFRAVREGATGEH